VDEVLLEVRTNVKAFTDKSIKRFIDPKPHDFVRRHQLLGAPLFQDRTITSYLSLQLRLQE
jgi:hypothetical protein